MTLQLTLPWWGLVLLFAPLVGFTIWRIVAVWRQHPERWTWIRRLVIVLLVICISLRPALPGASRAAGNALLDVYFVIDRTTSVIAEDYNGSQQRIEGMRQDVKDIVKELVGARFSVVTFANQTTTQLPLTSDTSALATTVDTIIPQEIYYGVGSSISQPVEFLEKELERIKKINPDRGRIIFYLGDGEQTVSEAPSSFAPLKPLVNGGAVLGYGTTSGGKMQEERYDDDPKITYLKDRSSKTYPLPEALSKLDEKNLNAIASQIGVQYTQRTKPGEIQQNTKDIDIGKIVKDSRDSDSYDDLYWAFAIPLAILLSYEAWRQTQATKALRKARKSGERS